MFDESRYPLTLGMLLFDEVEVLDFCGPFEVFSVTTLAGSKPIKVITVAETERVQARNGLSVNVDFQLDTAPKIDILLIPGGQGTRTEISNTKLIEWIFSRSQEAEMVLSVCTGALLLAKAELLDGLKACTHHKGVDLLRNLAPDCEICLDRRFVDNGKFTLSAGISAGIDMSFYIVQRLFGKEVASETARYMEYNAVLEE